MKAVIPAAGLGTRFLPYTKAQPKEMLPVVDKPTIQYVLEEAVQAGLRDVLIVTGRGKRAIEDHFDKNIELEAHLRGKDRNEALEELERLWKIARIHYVRQGEPLGLGHAILAAESHVGPEPFACLLGDDITVDTTPCIGQLIDAFHRRNGSIIAVQRVPRERVGRYGMIVTEEEREGLRRVVDVVEKPEEGETRSDLVAIGRYVLSPSVFLHLRRVRPSRGNEIQLSDALREMAQEEGVWAYEFRGRRYDMGNKLEWVLATVEFALERGEMREDLLVRLKDLLVTASRP